MWSTEHSIETTTSAEAIWGAFAAYSTISMTPIGQDTVELRIEDAIEPKLFVDVADLGDVVVRTIHRVESLDGERSRVPYRMEIADPAADSVGPALGPQISRDFPETLASLVDRAQREAGKPGR